MIIPPHYKITTGILDLLTKIEAQKIILSTENIPEKLKQKIQRISLLKSSLFSARIEGNPLTLENIEYSKDQLRKTEVFNILNASAFIDKQVKKDQLINKDTIVKLHQLVMKDIGVGGVFRKEASAIFNMAGVPVYLPPPPSAINNNLKQLFNFINLDNEKITLIKALIAHLIFEKIHPFLDGNGRVGRLLIFAVLKSKGYHFGLTIPFEKYLDEHKSQYYQTLDNGLLKTGDYLLFMLNSIYEESKITISTIAEEKTKEEDLYLLPPRQEEIVRIVKDHVFVSFDFLQRRFNKIPGRTLRYDLKKLQEKNLIIKTGKTRGNYYKIKQIKSS